MIKQESRGERPIVEIFFLRFYFILERREGREKEGEKHQCVVASYAAAPTGDVAHNPGMCLDWEWNQQPFAPQSSPALNQLSHASQGCRDF